MIFSVWGHVHTTFAILHFPPLTPCLHFHATSLTKLPYCICFWDTSFPLPVQISYNLFWFTKTRYRTNRPAAIMREASWIYGIWGYFPMILLVVRRTCKVGSKKIKKNRTTTRPSVQRCCCQGGVWLWLTLVGQIFLVWFGPVRFG